MRMLKSGLKLVLDIDWIFTDDNSDLVDIVVNHNTYDGVVYWQETVGQDPILSNFDVKLPLNHRYVITYYNPNNEAAGSGRFDTFGIEEEYTKDVADYDTGYSVVFLWFYDVDSEGVGGSDFSLIISDRGIRLSPMYMGNYNIRIYQLD